MLIDDYTINNRKSIDRAELSVAHLKSFFARNLAIEIVHDRICTYVRLRLEHAKPATVRLELAALRRMFTLGLRTGKGAIKPAFPTLSMNNARTGIFEPNQLRAVLAELPDHLRPLVQFLAMTGWRVSEGTSLRWAQVDFAGGVVRLEVGTVAKFAASSLRGGARVNALAFPIGSCTIEDADSRCISFRGAGQCGSLLRRTTSDTSGVAAPLGGRRLHATPAP